MERPARCPIHDVQRLIGGKWCVVVLWHLREGTRRFAEIERAIGDVSAKSLTESLRHLEHEGLVTRTVHPVVPPRVDYALTPLGRTLVPILESLQEWSLRHGSEIRPDAPTEV
jgi:DNA-binding HxlR family transcriptional regulator